MQTSVDIEEVDAAEQHLLEYLRGCLPDGNAR